MSTSCASAAHGAAPAGRRIRVFLLDDHELVRLAVAALLDLQPDLEVVGEASTVAEALTLIPLARPDVALLDVRLPDGNGTRVCRELSAAMPGTAFVMLSSDTDEAAIVQAFVAGAAGYLVKNLRGGRLVQTIRTVSASRTPRDLARRQAEQLHAVRVGRTAILTSAESPAHSWPAAPRG